MAADAKVHHIDVISEVAIVLKDLLANVTPVSSGLSVIFDHSGVCMQNFFDNSQRRNGIERIARANL